MTKILEHTFLWLQSIGMECNTVRLFIACVIVVMPIFFFYIKQSVGL